MSEPKLLRRTNLPTYLRDKHGIILAYQTLSKYACVGGGPKFRKFGNQALYEPDEVDRWVVERLKPPAGPCQGQAA